MDTFKFGDVIAGKYEVTRILGSGGMGTVVAVRRLDVGLPFALKFLHRSLGTREGMDRFLREAQAGMHIKSPHVPQVHDVVITDDLSFIVMEHLTGQDFAAVLVERGPFPLDELVDLLLQVCEAIAEAHSLGIIHRDLKPGNLFLTKGPDGLPLVKVLDFGIAKSTAPDSVSITATTGTLGSARYMSPEQLTSPKHVDARADVWALGVILYEMLAGTPPFDGETFATASKAVLDGIYPKLSERRPDIPPELDEILGETLVRDREERFPSVEAFAANLAPFGTVKAQTSYALIERIAASAKARAERAIEANDGPTSVPQDGGVVTADAQGLTSVHAPEKPPSGAAARPTPRMSNGALASATTLLVALGAVGWGVGTRSRGADSPAPADRAAVAPSTSTLASASASSAPLPLVVASTSATASAAPPLETVASAAPAASARTQSPGASACAHGATAACEVACAANVPGTCVALAKAFEKGVGTAKKPDRAAVLYGVACDAGDPLSCNNLGRLYAIGSGVPHDDAKAVALYTRACDGAPLGCLNLGSMHFTGSGVPKNEALGAQYFLRACQGHEPLGCLDLSIAYGTGKGAPHDPEQAVAYAQQACAGGATAGCVRVGLARIAGDGTTKDVKAGLAQIDTSCAHGDAPSCEALAKLYARGAGSDVPVDALRVRTYRAKACDLGSKGSCGTSSLLGDVDHLNNTAAQATTLQQRKCDEGKMSDCAGLGESLISGGAGPVDRPRGMALLQKACAGGYAPACGKLDGAVQ